jgi:hypothetical protein
MTWCKIGTLTGENNLDVNSFSPKDRSSHEIDGIKWSNDRSYSQMPIDFYHKLSEDSLQQLLVWLESVLDTTPIKEADVEYSMGVLTLRLGPHGTYVLNKQPPNRQIWFSSPIR